MKTSIKQSKITVLKLLFTNTYMPGTVQSALMSIIIVSIEL